MLKHLSSLTITTWMLFYEDQNLRKPFLFIMGETTESVLNNIYLQYHVWHGLVVGKPSVLISVMTN